MIYFVGAGPGALDLITVRAQRLLEAADAVIYAGSLVNEALLQCVKDGCAVYNSAEMTLEDICAAMLDHDGECNTVVRLHTGDPSIYGAIAEQMRILDANGRPYEVVPGVSAFCAAAAALKAEYTLPGVSQSVVLTRMEGQTPVPERESIEAWAAHGASMAIFLSSSMLDSLSGKLIAGGYAADTPAAIVYKASWPEEKCVRTTVAQLAEAAAQHGIRKTALILVGGFLGGESERSRLYDPAFSHEYRKAKV